MFDIAWSELALIGAVALVVIGPKDLPRVMRVMGQWTRKARLLAGEFQHSFDELVRQAELDEVRRQVQSVNPAAIKQKMQQEMETLIDPKAIEEALKVDPDFGKAVKPETSAMPEQPTTPPDAVPTPAPDRIPVPGPDIIPPPAPEVVPPPGPEIVPPPARELPSRDIPPEIVPPGQSPVRQAAVTDGTGQKPDEAKL